MKHPHKQHIKIHGLPSLAAQSWLAWLPPATVLWLCCGPLLGIVSITAICLGAGLSLGCLSASSFTRCLTDFPLHISFPPLFFVFFSLSPVPASDTHTHKQGPVTSHSAVIYLCLCPSSVRNILTFTGKQHRAQWFSLNIIHHACETALFEQPVLGKKQQWCCCIVFKPLSYYCVMPHHCKPAVKGCG